MILLSYDHCPYCVKARMIFGFKNVPFELRNLLNDDEATPISLIGQKMLPILIRENGEPMPESLDIISYIDGLSEFGPRQVGPSLQNAFLDQWLKDIRRYHYALAMPRWVKMPLPEFATPSAIDYFTRKKELSIGPFAKAWERTPQLVAEAHDHLGVLADFIEPKPFLWGAQLSLDDFHLFASLRCLTTCREIRFPKVIETYLNFISERARVPLHWEHAC